jgi:hypothetical protein
MPMVLFYYEIRAEKKRDYVQHLKLNGVSDHKKKNATR